MATIYRRETLSFVNSLPNRCENRNDYCYEEVDYRTDLAAMTDDALQERRRTLRWAFDSHEVLPCKLEGQLVDEYVQLKAELHRRTRT